MTSFFLYVFFSEGHSFFLDAQLGNTHYPTITNSMEQSPSWEATSFVASQENTRILLNLKVHYWIHKCHSLVSILRQPNLVQTPTSHFLNIHPNVIIALVSPWVSFPQVFPSKPIHTSLLPIRATCSAHLILLDFISGKILGEECRSRSFQLRCFLHSPVTSPLLGPNILLNTLFSTPSTYVPPSMSSSKFRTHKKQLLSEMFLKIITLTVLM
jgi:hypothetical protein